MTILRSWLFVPGNQERRVNKAKRVYADVIVYDLEDSVPAEEKGNARQLVSRALREGGAKLPYVRVNDEASGWMADDLSAVIQPALSGVVLPKASNVSQIIRTDEWIAQLERQHGLHEGAIDLVPLIETAEGVHRAYELAGSCRRVRRLAFGSVDYMLDINGTLTEEGLELLYPRSQLVVQSRAAGIEAPIDAAYIRIHDEAGLRKDTATARQLGFQGRLVIHPDQVNPVNELFAPSAKEIEEAKLVIEAYRRSTATGRAAVQVNGKMVDLPVVLRCSKLLAAAIELGLVHEE